MGKKVAKATQRSSSRINSKAKKTAPTSKTATKRNTKPSTPKAAPKKTPIRKAVIKAPARKAPVKKTARKAPVKKTAAKRGLPKPPPKRAVPKKAAPSGPKGYTADENAKYKAFVAKFRDMSNQALKDILRKNMQSMSGNKDELIYKCADGATLGRIPRCPNCFGGRPKYDNQKGTYYCSGYRDDTDFHNCHSTFAKGDLTRDTWEN